MILDQKRNNKANRFFENSELLGFQVEDANGWERSTGSNEYCRTVYVLDDERPQGPTRAVTLVVVFEKDTDEISDVSIDGHNVPVPPILK
jgi:hypothetical protein